MCRRIDRWAEFGFEGEFRGWVGGVGEIECESDSCPTSVQTPKDEEGEVRGDRCQAVSENSQLTYCAQIELMLSPLSSRHRVKGKS